MLATAAAFHRWSGSGADAADAAMLRMATADGGLNSFPALSSDGKLLVFASDRSNEGHLDIWLQQIGGRDPVRLTRDPADKMDPAFSPDGTRIAYRSEANAALFAGREVAGILDRPRRFVRRRCGAHVYRGVGRR